MLGTPIKVMQKSTYDANDDGIADKAEGIRVLGEIPSDLTNFADGEMFKVGNKTYVVNNE